MNLVSAGHAKKVFYAVSKLATSCIFLVHKFSRVLKVTRREIWSIGIAAVVGTIPWKGARLGHKRDLDNPI
jgi:hypothetical protein